MFPSPGEIVERLQAFLELGGDVLALILMVTFVMWILIVERLLYMVWGHPQQARQVVQEWQARTDRSSWYAEQVRRMKVAQVSASANRSLPTIKTLVALCPLLGLLGTVTGMIEVFDVMAITGSGNVRAMASGVSKATVPTMAGMAAAISGFYFSVRLTQVARAKVMKLEDQLSRN